MIYLICPSNYFLMPYVSIYVDQINKMKIDYKIIYWDRIHKYEEVPNSIVYRDEFENFNRGIKQYIKYYLFIRKNIRKGAKKIIIFSPQLIPSIFFLKRSFIIDIRDYHKIMDKKIIKNKMKNAEFITVSSKKYMELLPDVRCFVNHNFNANTEILKSKNKLVNTKIVISNIGAIRDFEANKNLIYNFANNEGYTIKFHGNGPDKVSLENYVQKNNINNVEFTGEYISSEENQLYSESDVINLVRDNTELNNRIALPNRLYKACKYNKPIITTEGTYLSEIVKEFDLGITVSSNIINNYQIQKLQTLLNDKNLESRQKDFLVKVVFENNDFLNELKKFLED